MQTDRLSLGEWYVMGVLAVYFPQKSAWIKLWLPPPFEFPEYVPARPRLQSVGGYCFIVRDRCGSVRGSVRQWVYPPKWSNSR